MGYFAKILLIYLGLAIAISIAAPTMVFNGSSPADTTLLSWFDMSYDSTTGNYSYDPSGQLAINETGAFGTSGANPTSGWIDTLSQVFDWVKLVFKTLGSPITLMTTGAMVDAPAGLVFIIGIPLVFMLVIGLIGFIRSGQL